VLVFVIVPHHARAEFDTFAHDVTEAISALEGNHRDYTRLTEEATQSLTELGSLESRCPVRAFSREKSNCAKRLSELQAAAIEYKARYMDYNEENFQLIVVLVGLERQDAGRFSQLIKMYMGVETRALYGASHLSNTTNQVQAHDVLLKLDRSLYQLSGQTLVCAQ